MSFRVINVFSGIKGCFPSDFHERKRTTSTNTRQCQFNALLMYLSRAVTCMTPGVGGRGGVGGVWGWGWGQVRKAGPYSRSDPMPADNVIGSIISSLTISRANWNSRTILLRSEDQCFIRNVITVVDYFYQQYRHGKIRILLVNIQQTMFCISLTICIHSVTLTTCTFLSNMACPNRAVSCMHWTGRDALVSAHIKWHIIFSVKD